MVAVASFEQVKAAGVKLEPVSAKQATVIKENVTEWRSVTQKRRTLETSAKGSATKTPKGSAFKLELPKTVIKPSVSKKSPPPDPVTPKFQEPKGKKDATPKDDFFKDKGKKDKAPKDDDPFKGKGKAKDDDPFKGKGKAKDDDPFKGKGKAKDDDPFKGKELKDGRGKGKPAPVEPPEPKGKQKVPDIEKGKGKPAPAEPPREPKRKVPDIEKGKGKPAPAEPPREPKGKGPDEEKGKGKGKDKDKDEAVVAPNNDYLLAMEWRSVTFERSPRQPAFRSRTYLSIAAG
jgi:hypothetical protein